MDIVSVGFVILLVLLSGAVAAVGDWLGRKLGKKRLRVGRLRPKHTAIFGTAIAGMLITLSTIIALSVVSAPVRKWLIEGSRVQAQLQRANDQLDATQRQVKATQDIVTGVRGQLKTEQERLADEQKKVQDATATVAQLKDDAAKLRRQVISFDEKLKKSTKDLEALQAEYADLKKTNDNLRNANTTFYDQNRALIDENNRLLALNDKYEGDVNSMQAEVDRLKKSAADAQELQKVATQRFEAESKRIESDRAKALSDLHDAETKLDAARQNLADLQRSALALMDDNTIARMSPLIYNRNDELARLSVRSSLSQAEARGLLLTVMEKASRDADSRGAIETPTSRSDVAFPALKNRDGSILTPEAQFQQTLMATAAKNKEQVLIVRALFNSFKGEWVPIRVDVLPNPVIYHLGDFIIETHVDGSTGVQKVTEALVDFMGGQLRDRVVRDGLIPAVGRPTEIGEISQEELQKIVSDIVAADRTITVRFHAAQETKAGDQLQLDVRLR
ncbi:MAG TPA: DUF3084 domain-containing protein [Fimbriimonadaceae bacterium]|nr:DUF3084 domain-containing protein [Fimbriimonadaceae bacterium]